MELEVGLCVMVAGRAKTVIPGCLVSSEQKVVSRKNIKAAIHYLLLTIYYSLLDSGQAGTTKAELIIHVRNDMGLARYYALLSAGLNPGI
jgi:hypothetical protein